MTVPMVDTERYPRDFAVSGSKQSLGMTALMSFDFGKSSGLSERALPFNPFENDYNMNKSNKVLS